MAEAARDQDRRQPDHEHQERHEGPAGEQDREGREQERKNVIHDAPDKHAPPLCQSPRRAPVEGRPGKTPAGLTDTLAVL